VTLLVGFDLDMTLLDTRPGIAATFRELSARTGVPVDIDLVVSRLGPPLANELAHWFPAERVDEVVGLYRALYPAYAIRPSLPLPGALAALDAVRAAGGSIAVITAKHEPLARLHLDHVGMAVDALVGDVFADGKADALRSLGASIYVGDHVADMRAALRAGPQVIGVGVPTGPCDADALTAAGARTVLTNLERFPQWLTGYRRRAGAISVGPTAGDD
jgi:phosphoglycolate phosphatase